MKQLVWMCVAALCAGTAFGQAQPTAGAKDAIFVGTLKVAPAILDAAQASGSAAALEQFSAALDAALLSALADTQVFQIVDRARLADVQAEQALAASGMVDAADPQAAKQFKLAGARFALLPQVDAFQDRSAKTVHADIGRESSAREVYAQVSMRVVDTTTGKLMASVPTLALTRTESIRLARAGEAAPDGSRVPAELARDLASGLCRKLLADVRPAHVLAVTAGVAMVNRGAAAGFAPGALVKFYAVETVFDEETGDSFANEVPVGAGTVERGSDRQSYVTIQGEDLGVARGCIARAEEPAVASAEPAGGALGARQSSGPATPAPAPAMTPGSSEQPW